MTLIAWFACDDEIRGKTTTKNIFIISEKHSPRAICEGCTHKRKRLSTWVSCIVFSCLHSVFSSVVFLLFSNLWRNLVRPRLLLAVSATLVGDSCPPSSCRSALAWCFYARRSGKPSLRSLSQTRTLAREAESDVPIAFAVTTAFVGPVGMRKDLHRIQFPKLTLPQD